MPAEPAFQKIRSESIHEDVVRSLPDILNATRTMLEDPRLEEVLPYMLTLARRFVPANAQAIWRWYEDGNRWTVLGSEGLSDQYARQFLPAGQMESSELVIMPDVEAAPELLQHRRAVYQAEGIRALIAAPLQLRSGIGGTLVFYFHRPHAPSEVELQWVRVVANLTALAVETAESFETQERKKQRARFLAEAGAILGSSLDYQKTLSSLSQILVPHVADWCSIDLLQEDGTLARVSIAHPDHRMVQLGREVQRRFPPRATGALARVLQNGQPELYPEISDTMLTSSATDPEHLRLLREMNIKSALLVPLIANGKTLGVLSLMMSDSGRSFMPSDLAFAEDLAQRAAIAVDNSRLHDALTMSEQRLQISQNAAGAWSWELDLDSGSMRRNRPLTKLWGLHPSFEVTSYAGLLESVHPEDRPLVERVFRQAVSGNESEQEVEYRVVLTDGSVKWIYSRGRLLDHEGKKMLAGIAMDITARKENDNQAAAVRVRLQLAQETGRIASWQRTLNTDAVIWSEGSAQLYGRPNESLRTRDMVMACIYPEDQRVISAAQARALAERSEYQVEFRTLWPDGSTHWLLSRAKVDCSPDGTPYRLVGVNVDITAQKEAENTLLKARDELESQIHLRTEALRKLSSRLLRLQDEERRRIARELHDSVGQYLSGLSINLSLLQAGQTGTRSKEELLADSVTAVQQSLTEIRTLSHLLHPPLLDEAGFASATRWYVDGFSKRSGIKVEFHAAPEIGRMPTSVEIALFRVVQESLNNVHRHSGSLAADIRLEYDAEQVILEVRDYGKGMPREALERYTQPGSQLGVGLAGMRERINELGGKIQISSEGEGTLVHVSIPLAIEIWKQ